MVKTAMTSASNSDNNFNEVEGKPTSHQNFMISGHGHSSQSITSHKLNTETYLQWSQFVKLFIHGHGKIGYLTGAIPRPQEGAVLIETWEVENAMTMSWLINSMEPKISKTYMFVPTAREI
ncbi:hypothetical protein CK203_054864 [Vitis vinifera]|uniref:Retrotransposon Copia-like N-terminal domain-containing protein n=1 Tax=Vitis vinifera TaxID=29760 RepID=A0A438GAT6_VITVI|nr:hypothetical protein CK203_054864 [Vitis vinifera]